MRISLKYTKYYAVIIHRWQCTPTWALWPYYFKSIIISVRISSKIRFHYLNTKEIILVESPFFPHFCFYFVSFSFTVLMLCFFFCFFWIATLYQFICFNSIYCFAIQNVKSYWEGGLFVTIVWVCLCVCIRYIQGYKLFIKWHRIFFNALKWMHFFWQSKQGTRAFFKYEKK